MNTEKRIERLERNNRLLMTSMIGICLLGIVFGCSSSSWGIADEIRARRVLLVDENGVLRVGLGATAEGPGLALFDENEVLRAGLSAESDGPVLAFYDEEEVVRVGLAVAHDGPALGMFDEKGQRRVMLYATDEGTMLTFLDENEEFRVILAQLPEEVGQRTTVLNLFDVKGNLILSSP